MGLPTEPYFDLLVETFDSGQVSGRHGTKHVRPISGQGYDSLVVSCNREMRDLFPIGTLFKIRAKLSNKEGGAEYLKSPHSWGYSVVTKAEARRFLANLQSPKTKLAK